MRITMFAMVIVGSLMYFFLDMVYVPASFFAGLPIIGFSLFLNYKSRVNLSVTLIATIMPLYFIGMSLFGKLNGEGLDFIFYILPRFGIIVITILTFAVLGFQKIGRSFIVAAFGLLCFFMFDKIHEWFGLDMVKNGFDPSDFYLVVMFIGLVFLFIIMITFFLQKVNSQYEKIVVDQKEAIEEKNRNLSQLNEEITAQRDEIEQQKNTVLEQKERIEEVHNEISQSIDYATRIQEAILSDPEILKRVFSDYFIIYHPKDKVSGDFYWWTRTSTHTIITVADCTGHGVPGAFMSMLGISLLREIVEKENIISSHEILFRLREELINTLSLHTADNSKEKETVKDGMDMSIIVKENEDNTVQYSGANNPLYLIRDHEDAKEEKELLEIKADKMPIAIYDKMDEFRETTISLKTGDRLFLFSDGFADQFGGPKGKKFKYKAFKKLLIESSSMEMENQKKQIDSTLKDWMHYVNEFTKEPFDQIDDITLLGLEN